MRTICPKCSERDVELGYNSKAHCMACGWSEDDRMPARVVIEIRGGALYAAYADQEIDLVLVDYDEDRSGASAEVVPDPLSEMSSETKRLVADAKGRHSEA